MLLYLSLLLPLIGGGAMALIKFRSSKERLIYTEAVVGVTSILVWIMLLTRTDETLTLYHMTDVFTLSFKVDGLSCVFAGLVATLWPLATLYGFEYMKHEHNENSFFAWYTMTYGVTLGIATAANLFTMYVSFLCVTRGMVIIVRHS